MKINELTENNKIGICYVDMDGVIAGCDMGLCNFVNMHPEEFFSVPRSARSKHWDKFLTDATNKSMEDFFANLGKESNADKLLNFLYNNNINFQILSRPVRPPYREDCIQGKNKWLKKYNITVPAIYEKDKEKYAINKSTGIPNILIDDLPENISKWNAKGGIGILYNNAKVNDALNTLRELFNL